MKTKFFLIALAAALAFSCSKDEESTSIDTDPDYFKITDVATLYAFVDSVALNPYFDAKLMANIDLANEPNWTPIPVFKGNFKGNKKTIKNFNIDASSTHAGFFSLCSEAYIENLGVSGNVVSSGSEYVGILAGQISDSTIVNNCATIIGSTVTSSSTYTGGLIGSISGGGQVTNSANTANVTSSVNNNTGGIAGYVWEGKITNCANTGTITKESGAYVGGIVGQILSNSTVDNCVNNGSVYIVENSYIGGICGNSGCTITNCKNTGDITSTLSSGNNGWVGGISGYSSFGTIDNCENSGTIISESYFTGGILGENYGAASSNNVNKGNVTCNATSENAFVGGVIGKVYGAGSYISGCSNYGTVTASAQYAGGIMGAGDSSPTTSDCLNYGKVEASGDNGVNIGGIAGGYNYGNASGNGYITNCNNYADIKGSETTASDGNTGGIVGYTYKYVVINGCSNSGYISVNNRAGGIAGLITNSTILNCYNTGKVEALGHVAGGIVSYIYSGANIQNCYNLGEIDADDYAGGLVGYNTNTVYNSYSAATISSSGSNVGAVVGYSTGTVADAYYDSEICTSNTSGYGTAKSTEEMKGTELLETLNTNATTPSLGVSNLANSAWESGSKGYPVFAAATQE